ncbi:MAG: carbohydrate ABC transporter permease [Lachnospiraceae bacterium]|nr:carbohydrate ABC transporter permease [Lachnospiraceae bacterium]MDE6601478.1 carbohydrate ABC transporter permease [Lachnospiraceae bacterium]
MTWLAVGICAAAAALICAPLLMIPGGALMDSAEVHRILAPVMGEGKGFAVWHLIPLYPTLDHFYRLLVESPAFYQLFWNTVGMTAAILAGQLAVGLPSAWAFAAFRFRGRHFLFGLYVVLMLLPFQVMLLPQYIVLQKLHLYNHAAAVILPAIFSTFPVFIMYRGFTQIDAEVTEAARLDGAGEMQIFFYVGLPLGKTGIQAAVVLGFLEYWNLVEQPMAFLEEQARWPLSLYLPQITVSQAGFAFAVSVMVLVPALFVFALGQDALEEGIAYIGVKT